MSRTLAERMQDWKFWLEQIGHIALGASALAIVDGYRAAGFAGWQIAAGVTTAIVWVIVREIIDGLPIESVGDFIFDSACTLLGGLAMGVTIWLVG